MTLLSSEPYIPQLVTASKLRKRDIMMTPKNILLEKVGASIPVGDGKILPIFDEQLQFH